MDTAEKTITLIAAIGANREIGFGGQMPWHLPGELKHFKETTMGKTVVMGRRTWESIGKALPGRQNIVVSRNQGYRAQDCEAVLSLDQAIAIAESDEVMIIGGAQLYQQALDIAHKMILTRVDIAPEADTWFPEWAELEWKLVSSRNQPQNENNRYSFRVQEWTRL